TLAAVFEDDRTVPRYIYVQSNSVSSRVGETLAHFDLFMTNLNVAPAGRRQITFRILRIKLLLVNILNVRADVGHAPGDAIVVSDNYARTARRRYAGHAQTRRAQVDQVPNRRS